LTELWAGKRIHWHNTEVRKRLYRWKDAVRQLRQCLITDADLAAVPDADTMTIDEFERRFASA